MKSLEEELAKTQELLETLETLQSRLSMILRHTLEGYKEKTTTSEQRLQSLMDELIKNGSPIENLKDPQEKQETSLSDLIWDKEKDDKTCSVNYFLY